MFEAFYSEYLEACDELAITPLSRDELVALIYDLLTPATCEAVSTWVAPT